jgi:hypothetical protein
MGLTELRFRTWTGCICIPYVLLEKAKKLLWYRVIYGYKSSDFIKDKII